MARTIRLGLALLAALAMGAGAQQNRTASPGKYSFAGAVGTSARVTGWFEIDIEGKLWLADGTCTPARQGSYETCTIASVKVRRVRSAYGLDVLVDVLLRKSDARGGNAGPASVQRYSATLSARRA